jgi:hypothetical protein
MFNRLPDRGQDTARQIGDFQGVQAALARATGYSSWENDNGARLTMAKDDEGQYDYDSAFAPGEGHVNLGSSRRRLFDDSRGTAGIGRPMIAREGDMYN